MLEVILRGRERDLAGLLIVLRLWRLVKLVQGMLSEVAVCCMELTIIRYCRQCGRTRRRYSTPAGGDQAGVGRSHRLAS